MEEVEKKKKGKILLTILADILFVLALFFLALIIAVDVIYLQSPIEGQSMAPTLNVNNDENAFINKYQKGESGDIVVVNTHELDVDGNEILIIKRIIAVAGDRINLKYNEANEVVVYLNGTLLNEDYVEYRDKRGVLPPINIEAQSVRTFKEYILNNDCDFNEDGLLIKENQVFVMGDNREVSLDSTKYGPFLKSDILGRLDFTTHSNENGKIMGVRYLLLKLFGLNEKTIA